MNSSHEAMFFGTLLTMQATIWLYKDVYRMTMEEKA